VYGMSNFISNIRGSAGARIGAEDGIVVHLAVVEQDGGGFAVESLEYTPVWIDPATKAVVPVGHALLAGVGPTATLQTSWDRTVSRVNRLGPSGAAPTGDPWPAVSCRGRLATIVGTPGDDVLVGTDGDDVIVGRGGNDSIWAGRGDDLVCGGEGDDFISGADGTDRLEGEDGDDVLMAYGGDDVLWGGDGDDVLSGGDGADLLVGGPGDDSLRGGHGGDVLWGGNGDDRSDAGPDDSCVAAGCS
ncbi:MAG: hypothetical protein MUP76_04225, partial [Acidimicrobiia bacterium]|nr:hypothetical protein [Acidimicrobiia bacterium]